MKTDGSVFSSLLTRDPLGKLDLNPEENILRVSNLTDTLLFFIVFRTGPFATGAIQSLTGEYRPGFFSPWALFLVGGLLPLSVDMNKDNDEASQYKADQQAKNRLMASTPPTAITVARDSVSRH